MIETTVVVVCVFVLFVGWALIARTAAHHHNKDCDHDRFADRD